MASRRTGFPRRGDIYYVNLDSGSRSGSEQTGARPAVVVSNNTNNQFSPVVIVAAMTTTMNEPPYPHTVVLPAGLPLQRAGTILCGQLVTIDKTRLEGYRGALSGDQIADLDRALVVSLGLPKTP